MSLYNILQEVRKDKFHEYLCKRGHPSTKQVKQDSQCTFVCHYAKPPAFPYFFSIVVNVWFPLQK